MSWRKVRVHMLRLTKDRTNPPSVPKRKRRRRRKQLRKKRKR